MSDHPTDDDGIYTGPETKLLKSALAMSGMSARQAATQMDLSDTRLRHIINGYQPVGRGQRIAVYGPSDTIARIARVLRVTPTQLRAAGRPDAADLLERQPTSTELVLDTDDVLNRLGEWAEDPEGFPPDDALRFYSDSSLLGELERRLGSLRGHLAGQAPEGHLDVTFHGRPVLIDALSVVPDEVAGLRAADIQERPISGEQGEPEDA